MSVSRPPDHQDDDRAFPYWRRNLLALPLANLLCGLGFAMSWPFLPLIVRELGVTQNLDTWLGNLMLVFYIVGFVCGPVWGSVADHFGRKTMVLRAMLGMGATMMLLPIAPSPMWFAGLFMLVGLFNGFSPASMSLIVGNTPAARMGRALSLVQTGNLLGATMGPALGAVIAPLLARSHWMFWISGGMLVSGGLLVALFVREVRQVAQGPWRLQWLGNLRTLCRVPPIASLLMVGFVFSLMWNGNVTVISIFMLQLLDEGPQSDMSDVFWVGAAATGLSLASVVAIPFWGRVLDRFAPT